MSTTAKIQTAYRRMAHEARYRPAAPSDGFGNITVPEEDLDLESEVRRYTAHFEQEERSRAFNIGVSDYRDQEALVYIVEAGRALCGMNPDLAADLLRMALAEVEARL